MKKLLLAFCLLLFAVPAFADQKLIFTVPITEPSTSEVEMSDLCLHRTARIIEATFVSPGGKTIACTQSGAAATATMRALNKANMVTKSLQQRAVEWGQTTGGPDGVPCLPAGAVTGTVE